jgi:hypothetical protein
MIRPSPIKTDDGNGWGSRKVIKECEMFSTSKKRSRKNDVKV